MNKAVKLSIGILISVLGLVYAFRSFNWSQFIDILSTVNYWYILGAVAIQLIAVWFRSIRLKWLLAPIKEIKTKPLFDATMIGYFGNNVLPFRMGELLRAYVISNKNGVSMPKVIGTLIIERFLDFLAVIVLAVLFFSFTDIIEYPKWIIGISIIVFLIIFIFILYIGKKNPDWKTIKQKRNIYNTKIGSKLFDFVTNMTSGVGVLIKTQHKIGIYSYIFLLWGLYYYTYILVLKGVGIDLSLANIGILFILLALSISIPAAPGYIGTFHAVAVAVLTNIFYIDNNLSQAFAVLCHATAFVPFVIVGAIIFVKYSLNLSSIKKLESVKI